jgi:hypothetical protein
MPAHLRLLMFLLSTIKFDLVGVGQLHVIIAED